PQNLTKGTASDDVQPAWNPRTAEIAFVSNRAGRSGHSVGSAYGIWLMRANGVIERRVTPDGTSPNWSPDGMRLTFVKDGSVWVVNRNGTGLTQLTFERPPVVDDKPVLSPDGRRIAFETGPKGGPVGKRGRGQAVTRADDGHRP